MSSLLKPFIQLAGLFFKLSELFNLRSHVLKSIRSNQESVWLEFSKTLRYVLFLNGSFLVGMLILSLTSYLIVYNQNEFFSWIIGLTLLAFWLLLASVYVKAQSLLRDSLNGLVENEKLYEKEIRELAEDRIHGKITPFSFSLLCLFGMVTSFALFHKGLAGSMPSLYSKNANLASWEWFFFSAAYLEHIGSLFKKLEYLPQPTHAVTRGLVTVFSLLTSLYGISFLKDAFSNRKVFLKAMKRLESLSLAEETDHSTIQNILRTLLATGHLFLFDLKVQRNKWFKDYLDDKKQDKPSAQQKLIMLSHLQYIISNIESKTYVKTLLHFHASEKNAEDYFDLSDALYELYEELKRELDSEKDENSEQKSFEEVFKKILKYDIPSTLSLENLKNFFWYSSNFGKNRIDSPPLREWFISQGVKVTQYTNLIKFSRPLEDEFFKYLLGYEIPEEEKSEFVTELFSQLKQWYVLRDQEKGRSRKNRVTDHFGEDDREFFMSKLQGFLKEKSSVYESELEREDLSNREQYILATKKEAIEEEQEVSQKEESSETVQTRNSTSPTSASISRKAKKAETHLDQVKALKKRYDALLEQNGLSLAGRLFLSELAQEKDTIGHIYSKYGLSFFSFYWESSEELRNWMLFTSSPLLQVSQTVKLDEPLQQYFFTEVRMWAEKEKFQPTTKEAKRLGKLLLEKMATWNRKRAEEKRTDGNLGTEKNISKNAFKISEDKESLLAEFEQWKTELLEQSKA